MELLAYLVKVTLVWIFFFGVYRLSYHRFTHFNLNRIYLIITVVLGLVLPLLAYVDGTSSIQPSIVVDYSAPIIYSIDEVFLHSAKVDNSAFWYSAFLFIYGLGFAYTLFNFLLGVIKIFKIALRADKQEQQGLVIYYSDHFHLPFSFYKWVFLSKSFPLANHEKLILNHERCHVQQGHTFDTIFLELVKIFFWCSPIIYFIKKELVKVHEYLADQFSSQNQDIKEYGQLLLGQSSASVELALTHHFFQAHLKNRLVMLKQKKSSNKSMALYALALPVILIVGLSFLPYSDSIPNEPLQTEMSETARNKNETAVMMDGNRVIPTKELSVLEIKDAPPLESSLIKFNLNNDHTLMTVDSHETDFDITVHSKYGEEQAVTQAGYEVNIAGLPTDVYLINYKSKDLRFNQVLQIYRAESESKDSSKQVFIQVDKMPQFPGCENDDCSQKKLIEYVVANLNYPKSAQQAGIEGVVVAQYVVDKNGVVNDINLVRNVSTDCDQASKALLEKMAEEVKWIPGQLRGEKVSVRMTLPIKFKLEEAQNSDDFILYQNVPNPFDDRTTIKFQMPTVGQATLNFYNIQGEVIKTIQGSYDQGIHEIEITAEELGIVGVVYYQLKVGKERTTRKMVIKERG